MRTLICTVAFLWNMVVVANPIRAQSQPAPTSDPPTEAAPLFQSDELLTLRIRAPLSTIFEDPRKAQREFVDNCRQLKG